MNNYNDAVMPFLWVRNEDDNTIEREIDAIKNLSINSFIVESRPHKLAESDFGTENWYVRMGKILAYAHKLNMHVWLLDDRSFPSGSANGKILEKYPNLKAKQLKCNSVDVFLNNETTFLLTGVKKESNDSLLYACLKNEKNIIALSFSGKDTIIKLPKLTGYYRAFFLIQTDDSPERNGYIDMLNPQSVEIMINEVYQPHFERFKEFFGSTFMGFFSDEPRFCNGINPYYGSPVSMYDYNVGKLNIAYPISNYVLEQLNMKGYVLSDLLSLFIENDGYSDFRVDYMDIITNQYSHNFVGQLSAWCHNHGVLYAGHIIEDMGVHFTTGCGAGHYFRAMKGADFAGIDVVLHQIKPYFSNKDSISPIEGGISESKFFNYTLAKLASSVAVQSDSAKGNSICELFGAYGWGESIKDMLYLVNHMAVRGINNFIPHAFSMNLNDIDCPPYFYGEGQNPSYDGYKKIFEYMNFLSQFSKRSFAKVAVLYNCDSVWSGNNYYSIDEIAKVLTENQVEFDFIDSDNLLKAKNNNGKISIEYCTYEYLIVPNGFYSKQTNDLINSLSLKVVYAKNSNFINKIKYYHLLKSKTTGLRVKCIQKDKYMLFNESSAVIHNTFYSDCKQLFLFDYFNKKILNMTNRGKLPFSIEAGQVLFIYTSIDEISDFNHNGYVKIQEIENVSLSICPFNKKEFTNLGIKPTNYCYLDDNFDFSGKVKYIFEINAKQNEKLIIDFYGEYLNVNVNGKETVYITNQPIIELDNCMNKIELVVCNTLANTMKDFLSNYSHISSCGINSISVIKELKQ